MLLDDLRRLVEPATIGQMLIAFGHSRQVNCKTKQGSHHPDRDGQLQHINRQVMATQAAGEPVISVTRVELHHQPAASRPTL